MNDPIKSISIIRNFMGNAGRNTCNDYLYEALQDAVEALERHIGMPLEDIRGNRDKGYIRFGTCPNCRKRVGDVEGGNFCKNCGQRLKWEEVENGKINHTR